MTELVSQLGLAGAIIAATIILLREIRKSSGSYEIRSDTRGDRSVRPPSNGRVGQLVAAVREDRMDSKIERLEENLRSQGVQLDCLSKEQCETRAVVERQIGKLDAILEIVRRS